MLGTLLGEVAQNWGARRETVARKIIFIILETELSRVLANDLDIIPAKALKALSGNITERRGEIDKVYAGEELGDIDEAGHGLNVPSRSSTDLYLVSYSLKVEGHDSQLTSTQIRLALSPFLGPLAFSCATTSASMSSLPCRRTFLVAS